MGTLKQIFDGYRYLIIENESIEAMAKERLALCDTCVDENGSPNVEYLNEKHHLYLHCKFCKCFIGALIRSPEKKCFLSKW